MSAPSIVYIDDGHWTEFRPTEGNYKNEGGEARVYLQSSNVGVRILKFPDDVSYRSNTSMQDAARERLEVYQTKVRDFPKDIPSNVLGPLAAVCDAPNGRVIGHTMRWVSGARDLFSLMNLTDPSAIIA